MICSNCKKEINDNSKFCEFCGNKVEAIQSQGDVLSQTAAPVVQNTGVQGVPVQNQNQMQIPKAPKKSINKKLLAIIIGGGCAVLLLLIIIIVLIVTHKKTLDLQDYTKVSFEGYDGYGTAKIDFNHEKFMDDVEEYGDIDDVDTEDVNKIEDWAELLSDSADAYDAINDVSYKLDKSERLSNGDKVKVKYDFDNDKAAKIGLKFKGEEKAFEVKGLKKVKEINPFDDLTVEFSGMAPNAEVDITSNSSEEVMSEIRFEADKSSGIAKGDKITVTVNADEDYILENYGCKLKETSKEYVCENVDEYITKYADISAEYLETIKSQAQDIINSYFAEESEYIQSGKLTFEGAYFLTNKDISTWSSHNILDIVYSTTVKSKEKSFKKTKVYIPIEFTDVQKYADGKCYVKLDSYERKGSTSLEYNWWSKVSGYTSIETMYNELVAAQKADYTEECSDNLK